MNQIVLNLHKADCQHRYIDLHCDKAFGKANHHARNLYFYGKNGKKNIVKKSRRLISKANELISYAVDIDFSAIYARQVRA